MGLRCGCENSDDDFMIMWRGGCLLKGRISVGPFFVAGGLVKGGMIVEDLENDRQNVHLETT